MTVNEFKNHFAVLKVNFSEGLESINSFQFYQTNFIHILISGKRELDNEVNAQFFAEFNNYLLYLGSPELRLNIL